MGEAGVIHPCACAAPKNAVVLPPSINVQAICDANRNFLWVDTNSRGPSHDVTALLRTDLARAMAAGTMPAQYHIVGDDAYKSALAQCITPYPGVDLPAYKDNANFFISRSRIEIGACKVPDMACARARTSH